MMGGILQTDHQPATIHHLILDSRIFQIQAGSLFFAIEGVRHNGHHYIAEVYQKGVRNFVVSDPSYISALQDINVILVENVLASLQKLAENHRNKFTYPVIGITGSNGKTIVKEWLAHLLDRDFNIVKSPKSYNSQTGVPLSLWRFQDEHNLALVEAGISEPGEMQLLARMIRPTTGIFTNVGPAHQENFADIDEKIKEKLSLFAEAETLIYCKDHPRIHEMIGVNFGDKPTRLLSWSRHPGADLVLTKETQNEDHTLLGGNFGGTYHEITIPFTHASSIENACHCWLLMLHMGISDAVIGSRMPLLPPIAMRLEQLAGINRCLVINDAYNSDVMSLEIALSQLKLQRKNKKFTAILSDILQSGEPQEILYGNVAALLHHYKVDRFIGIGPQLSAHSGLFSGENTRFFPDTETFLHTFRKDDFREENILIKGARNFAFERISERLEEQTHETILEIDLNRMQQNLNYIRTLLKPSTKIMAMVKAFAYGSGGYEIARFLEFNRVDYLAVAYTDEGVALRQTGIEMPIMVLNPEISGYDSMIRYRLEPQIYNFRTLQSFLQALERSDLEGAFPVHLKINTGMNRLGFDLLEIEALSAAIARTDLIRVVSVFSHLAASESAEHDARTLAQISAFEKAADQLRDILPQPFLRHILNSNGIDRHPDAQYEMVRLGLALYGISPDTEARKQLNPVSRLVTTISQIRIVPKGEGIGYSPKKLLATEKRIAVIPIGYADGMPRKLGNGIGHVVIDGKKAPFIGNICMDMSMVDITNISCAEGDEVEVFGEHRSIYALADELETIPYEVLTNISQRVKRVFHSE